MMCLSILSEALIRLLFDDMSHCHILDTVSFLSDEMSHYLICGIVLVLFLSKACFTLSSGSLFCLINCLTISPGILFRLFSFRNMSHYIIWGTL